VSSCCRDYAAAADQHFDAQRAARDLQGYRHKGPGVTTRLLREGLAAAGRISGSLVDIGAGVGALTFELLDRGVTHAIAIDASAAYVDAASREAARRGRSGAVQVVHGDFLCVAAQIPPAAIVALDRAICCYPTFEPLLTEALQHAQRAFAFSYPRDVWYVHAGNAVTNAGRRVKGRPFRTFVHSAAQMEQIITHAGFDLAVRRQTSTWRVDVYLKSGATGINDSGERTT
jgi:tRNA1(Val) A37 N6-methylase TrmN6